MVHQDNVWNLANVNQKDTTRAISMTSFWGFSCWIDFTHYPGVSFSDFEQVIDEVVLESLLLTLNKFYTFI